MLFKRSKRNSTSGKKLEMPDRKGGTPLVPSDDRDASTANSSDQGLDSGVDWDLEAQKEIQQLLRNENGVSAEQIDSELESIRKAIASRKAKGRTQTPAPGPDAGAKQAAHFAQPVEGNTEDEEDKRLNWLVDFMGDHDGRASRDVSRNIGRPDQKPAPDGSRPNRPSSTDRALPPDAGFDADDIRISLPGNQKPDTGFPAGDGYSNTVPPPRGPEPVSSKPQAAPTRPQPKIEQVKPASRPVTQSTEKQQPPVRPPSGEKSQSESQAPEGGQTIRTRDRVVGILLKKKLITPSQVREAQRRKEQENRKESLWRILTLIVPENEPIFAEAARIYAFPFADTEGKLDAKFARSVLETLSEENRDRLINLKLVPFECEAEQVVGGVKLVFITHDPMRAEVRQVMKELKLDRFDLYYAPRAAVDTLIGEAFPRKNVYLDRIQDDPMAFDLGMSYDEGAELIDEDLLEAEINRSSLLNLFEATLVESVRQGASDIHIYPNASKRVEIHFRIDGRLTLWHTEQKVHPEALLAIIKDNAMNVDRFERDAAQDGFIQRWIDDALIRFRVSVLPIANASNEIRSESIVIRVLDDRKVITDLRHLGLLDLALKRVEQAISQPHGMVILTGPTGSGKSTSLVAALHRVITPELNVLTVEDPVEYIIQGVRQIKLNHKLELEDALRAILRHDPDVVMVGEMRDRKTAELAIKLANTGHLTFSTLHTNDAPSAISRLYKMGIEPFLIAYAINLVVAQRLIRKLCPTCKIRDEDPDPVMLRELGFTAEDIKTLPFYLPNNNPSCKTCRGVGYKGRRAVSEALYFSRVIRHMIVESQNNIDEQGIRNQAVKEGMLTLRDSAREVVKMGETSVREMIRVVATE